MEVQEVIQINNITKDYGNGKGIFDVTLQVKKGEVFGYLGPNGAGKTTTIRHLMGFCRPDRGELTIFGMDCFTKAADIQKKLGYLAGEIAFIEDMKGEAYIRFIAELKGVKQNHRIIELMDLFELNPKGKIKKMSKGMKQKIGIICAFMNDPEVLILDEPTSGLDPLMQNRFIELLLEEKKKGTTIIISSHIFEEVEKTCDRTAMIRSGHIVAIEDMKQLISKKKKRYCITLDNEAEAEKLIQSHKFNIYCYEKNKVIILENSSVSSLLKELSNYAITDIDIKGQTLEELFLHYYSREEQ